MRILITGSRDWPDPQIIADAIKQELGPSPELEWSVVIHGACPTGADAQASQVVQALRDEGGYHTVYEEQHPADWNKHGKRAGYLRNKEMVDAGADICLAFIKDNSRGASMTLDLAKKAGIPTSVWRL